MIASDTLITQFSQLNLILDIIKAPVGFLKK